MLYGIQSRVRLNRPLARALMDDVACEFACAVSNSSISYLESSFLTAHVGSTKRATLERSVRGAVLIGCSKTMQMTGSKLETQYGGQHAKENSLQA